MKTAEERIKEAFPDWHDWPEWAVDATVEMMKEYARDVATDTLERAAKRKEHSVYGRSVIKETKIVTP